VKSRSKSALRSEFRSEMPFPAPVRPNFCVWQHRQSPKKDCVERVPERFSGLHRGAFRIHLASQMPHDSAQFSPMSPLYPVVPM
jgi:hypothetical protein